MILEILENPRENIWKLKANTNDFHSSGVVDKLIQHTGDFVEDGNDFVNERDVPVRCFLCGI